MQYRRLGRTGLQVSEIALGTVELGLDYGIPSGDHLRPSYAEAEALLHRALDLGINYIDTARAYGESEAVIGRALCGRRRAFVLASKVVLPPGVDDDQLRQSIVDSVSASLKALRTDTIDLLQVHSATAEQIRRGAVTAALEDLRRAGLIRYLGATTYGEEAALAVIEDGRFDCLQVAYNLLDRRLEQHVLPLAQQADIGVVVRSVLLKGVLTHRAGALPDALEELRSAAARLDAIAAAEGVSLPALAYRFVLDHAAVSAALVGTAHIAELELACSYAELLPAAQRLFERARAVSVHDVRLLDPSAWSI
ncbi:MAG: hypothetical protein RLZZ387_708 [Chloroflexota bacterium]|jgi:aryl-alcohol dehydrogenase-like predicted oxidoreductase